MLVCVCSAGVVSVVLCSTSLFFVKFDGLCAVCSMCQMPPTLERQVGRRGSGATMTSGRYQRVLVGVHGYCITALSLLKTFVA